MPPLITGVTLKRGAAAVAAAYFRGANVVSSYPVPSNNKIALFGDSRTANSSYFGGYQYTKCLQHNGYAPWLLAATGYRVEISEVYAVPGQDIWYNRDQLTSVPGAGGSVYKGNVLSGGDGTLNNPYPTQAATVIMLCGVNGVNGAHSGYIGTLEPWERSGYGTKWLYDEMISAFDAAGKNLLLCNEIPNTNDNGSDVAQLERRQKLMDYPVPSNKVVKVNTFDQLASAPGVNTYKAGYVKAGEKVHQNIRGSRALGEYLASIINVMYKDFPARNQLPESYQQAGWIHANTMAQGVAGTKTGITGDVATGMIASASLSGTIVCDASIVVGVDGYYEQVFHVYGTGVAAANTIGTLSIGRPAANSLNAGSAASPIAINGVSTYDNDRIFTIGEVKLEAGNIGVVGINPTVSAQCSGVAGFTSDTGSLSEKPSTVISYSEDFGGEAYGPIALMSQPVTLPVGWSSGAATSRVIYGTIKINYFTDRAIDFTVRIKRFGIVKNR